MPFMDARRATSKSSGCTSAATLALMAVVLSGVPPAAVHAAAQRPRTAAEHRARDSQRNFESLRRFHLPVVAPREGGCDVSIGRLCYWDDNDDPALPAEAARVSAAREVFRHTLDSLALQDSTSDFIVGQQVRYALESPTDSDATAILAHCAATPWWCNALRGLVWHRAGQEALSAQAYDSALAAMPDTLRCQWLDVHPWLPPGVDDPPADRPTCTERARVSARLFWLAAPLLTWRPHAARDEFLARRTIAAVEAGTAIPEGLSWGSDIEEVALRYGWPTRWAREQSRLEVLSDPEVRVVVHEPRPSFSLVPDRHALEHALQATPSDWTLADTHAPPMRYAPGWLLRIDTLPVQIARFRRSGSDSMIIVAAFDARATRVDSARPAMAGALLAVDPDSELALMRASSHTGAGSFTLRAPARDALMAVEFLDSTNAVAARWRAGVTPLPHDALLSDLLIGLADSTTQLPSLANAASGAIGSLSIAAGDTVALYWESYAPASAEHPARVALRLTPLDHGLLHGIARVVGLARADHPVSLEWNDPGRPDSASGRALRVAIPDIPAGHYRIELAIQSGDARSSATRDITVTAPQATRPPE
jgi:hypothetical protein